MKAIVSLRNPRVLFGVLVLLVVATLIGISPWAQSSSWQRSQGAAWLDATLKQLRPLFMNDVPQPPTA